MTEGCLFVFAGTTEGRVFIERLGERAGNSWRVVAFTATEYGAELLRGTGCEIRTGRLDSGQMAAEMRAARPRLVIDATHPYAAEAGENIQAACEASGCPYVRLARENSGVSGEEGRLIFVNSPGEAAGYLRDKEGGVFLATGVKEAEFFSGEALRDRVFVRVLPAAESLETCAALGFPPGHIIAMQGPFSEDMNRACLRHSGAAWLVTKRCGKTGGYEEKVRAALAENAGVVVIEPPEQRQGYTLEEALRMVSGGETAVVGGEGAGKTVFLVGAGTGSPELLTGEGREALARGECVIGAERVLAAHEKLLGSRPRKALFDAEKIAAFIGESGYARFCVLLSGDGGFYSLAKTLTPLIRARGWQFRVLPGISSLALLAARLGISWEDIQTVSLHGKNETAENTENIIVGSVTRNRRTFFLTGGKTGPAEICGILAARGLGSLDVAAGENLSLPEEVLRRGSAAAFASAAFAPLSVVLVENPAPLDDSAKNAGLGDRVFIRGEVPMTKAEIRLLSVARLRVSGTDVVWDIGAGTGSVSCAAAFQAGYGRVYAVERDERALQLIRQNRDALGLCNIEIVPGNAPEALEGLPAPDCVFVGGAGGRLGSILDAVFARNPRCRMVLTAISLETLAEAASEIRRLSGEEPEIIQVAVSRVVKAGNHHLLKAENPVFIVSFQGGGT